MWYRLLMCDLIIPIVMLISGRMMWKHCPKRINNIVGYRTTRSMKNMDTWRFAHDYCGKLWWKTGWVMIIPSVLIHIPLYHSDKNTIGFAGIILVTIQCFIMILSIYPTEKALKKHFNDDGIPRQIPVCHCHIIDFSPTGAIAGRFFFIFLLTSHIVVILF